MVVGQAHAGFVKGVKMPLEGVGHDPSKSGRKQNVTEHESEARVS